MKNICKLSLVLGVLFIAVNGLALDLSLDKVSESKLDSFLDTAAAKNETKSLPDDKKVCQNYDVITQVNTDNFEKEVIFPEGIAVVYFEKEETQTPDGEYGDADNYEYDAVNAEKNEDNGFRKFAESYGCGAVGFFRLYISAEESSNPKVISFLKEYDIKSLPAVGIFENGRVSGIIDNDNESNLMKEAESQLLFLLQ